MEAVGQMPVDSPDGSGGWRNFDFKWLIIGVSVVVVAYLALMPATNPQSPLNLYPRAALVQTSVSAVTPAGPNTARVHFVTERRDTPTAAPQRSFWVAEIDWRFTGEPASADDRLVNPLGFAVTRYRRDQEALPQGVVPASQPAAIAPASAPAAYPTPIGPRGATP